MEAAAAHAPGAWQQVHGKSWDAASAFDRVDPRIVAVLWRHLGAPPHVVVSLTRSWERQSRI
eukprot:14556633-Alexandrium_andersonii.AAC.1